MFSEAIATLSSKEVDVSAYTGEVFDLWVSHNRIAEAIVHRSKAIIRGHLKYPIKVEMEIDYDSDDQGSSFPVGRFTVKPDLPVEIVHNIRTSLGCDFLSSHEISCFDVGSLLELILEHDALIGDHVLLATALGIFGYEPTSEQLVVIASVANENSLGSEELDQQYIHAYQRLQSLLDNISSIEKEDETLIFEPA